MTNRRLPPALPPQAYHREMTRDGPPVRRLPPALERRVFKRSPIEPHGFLEGEVVFDWLYGRVDTGWDITQVTPGLVERVEERLYEDGAQDWQDALRAELGEEA